MTLANLQKAASGLTPEEQDQLIALLVHLRQQRDSFIHECLERRATDRGCGKWMTVEAFEAKRSND